MKYNKFKVGDQVRVIKNSTGSSNMVGDIGTIIEVDDDAIPYKVLVEERGDELGNYHRESDLEIVRLAFSGIEDNAPWRYGSLERPYGDFIATQAAAMLDLRIQTNKLWAPKPPAHKKGIIMSVVDKIKNFKLTKEDRILRENGLEDEDGMTLEARQMMSDECVSERWANRRLEVAADLLAIKAEDKQ